MVDVGSIAVVLQFWEHKKLLCLGPDRGHKPLFETLVKQADFT